MNIVSKTIQCFFSRSAAAQDEKILLADVILGQSFGCRSDGPGKSNEVLAGIAYQLHKKYDLPMILQREIAVCLKSLPVIPIENHRIPGKRIDSYEALLQSALICRKYGWKNAIVIAHPDHLWRCSMIAKKLGFEVVPVDTSVVPYDPDSDQARTRSAWLFWPWEYASRIYYLLTGKI